MLKVSPRVNVYILLIIFAIDFIWLRSSYGKITGGKFVSTLGTTLEKFASNNPYPFIKQFLVSVAIPNSQMFGLLTMWGEFFVGISLFTGLAMLLLGKGNLKIASFLVAAGLFVGIFLNAVFWFASGWSSASTESLNLLMFTVSATGLVAILMATN